MSNGKMKFVCVAQLQNVSFCCSSLILIYSPAILSIRVITASNALSLALASQKNAVLAIAAGSSVKMSVAPVWSTLDQGSFRVDTLPNPFNVTMRAIPMRCKNIPKNVAKKLSSSSFHPVGMLLKQIAAMPAVSIQFVQKSACT